MPAYRFCEWWRSLTPAVASQLCCRCWAGSQAWVDVCYAEYPGRGLRWRHSLVVSLSVLLNEFDEALSEISDLPLVLFGSNFGALVAFLLGQRLTQRGGSLAGLIAASAKAPVHAEAERYWNRPDDARLLAALRELCDIPEKVLCNPEMLEIIMPIIRADLSCYNVFVHPVAGGIDCPVLALHGNADPMVSQAELADWLKEAGGWHGYSRLQSLQTSHFLEHGDTAAVQVTIAAWLKSLPQTRPDVASLMESGVAV